MGNSRDSADTRDSPAHKQSDGLITNSTTAGERSGRSGSGSGSGTFPRGLTPPSAAAGIVQKVKKKIRRGGMCNRKNGGNVADRLSIPDTYNSFDEPVGCRLLDQ